MLTGAILAGGQNSRMGGFNKALLRIEGESFLTRQWKEMEKVCSEIVLVTNRADWYKEYVSPFVRVVSDYVPDRGPLSGMEAAFAAARNERIWVVGCDEPFISASAARFMMERWERELIREQIDAVIPFVDGHLQMLHGLYHQSCAELVSKLLREGQFRLRSLLDHIRYIQIDEADFIGHKLNPRFAIDVDTPEQYEMLSRDDI
ncbi:molybdenum cofactor guanylyltransferase [Paenibacillus sediminis]|uniref:Molybdopterin-guanine dinucleotide biosynthesis protein A n=1 Tax=Paenibacillus sediminis TaxID=664909 RepID=A0ABS4H4U7_9BACL|nr:molybdenum cofactor guanylyltransferase [Paenibacillus sediminis]MBP1937554.1 molybdopterin-guanine dinucleotide biosynthesis protein A [Paenibacillus sediminis]